MQVQNCGVGCFRSDYLIPRKEKKGDRELGIGIGLLGWELQYGIRGNGRKTAFNPEKQCTEAGSGSEGQYRQHD